jgi:hypothetical protein
MRNRLIVLAAPCLAAAMVAPALAAPSHAQGAAIRLSTVGTVGNEPLTAVAPDGTVYVSALQYIYRSTDKGAHWTSVPLPVNSGVTEYKSDSSIAVDPGGRLYYTFDYPYAGITAVCTSDDRGDTWHCDNATIPGGTDRMWISAPTKTEAFLTTNEGLYQPVFASTSDRGATWQVRGTGNSGANPYTGVPVARATGPVIQPVNVGSDLVVNIYSRTAGTLDPSQTVKTGLPASNTGPSAAFDAAGVLYTATEAANDDGGRGVTIGRSTDNGKKWTRLPALPGSQTGTAIFTAVAAGARGHVGVLYYWTPSSKAPDSVPANAIWYARYVDSTNADSAHPTWRLTTLEKLQHKGLICRGLNCDLDESSTPPKKTAARFAGDFVGASIGPDGAAYLSWMGADKQPGNLPVDPSSDYGVLRFARVPASR